ncbi:High-affinity zinc uptake system protein znuA precursor [uncultured Flavonifractor sp.]|nr:High-affinity zinc uptake system protein znuA precursor [uncultured Flavonifractor sp.]
MKKIILAFLLLALLLPAVGCAAQEEKERVTVVATTYPIYLFARAVTDGTEGVVVERLDTGSASCLHDYTLSMADMKKLERADLIALNGAGLEDFLSDALATSDAEVVDCSAGAELLENLSHDHKEGDEDHDHGHYDPHYWMDPASVPTMLDNLVEGLVQIMPEWEPLLRTNTGLAADLVERELLDTYQGRDGGGLTHRELITFHDGFQYFARAFDLELLAAIEEEAGSEASAKEIVEISQLVREHDIPAIFTEVNGSDATANAIGRETGCQVWMLDMLMSGDDVPQDWGLEKIMEQYISRMKGDLETVREALG